MGRFAVSCWSVDPLIGSGLGSSERFRRGRERDDWVCPPAANAGWSLRNCHSLSLYGACWNVGPLRISEAGSVSFSGHDERAEGDLRGFLIYFLLPNELKFGSFYTTGILARYNTGIVAVVACSFAVPTPQGGSPMVPALHLSPTTPVAHDTRPSSLGTRSPVFPQRSLY